MSYPPYYRNGPRYDKIDQDEVPESKHTVFIRGLPGHIKTDEVKDFFEDHVGPCSFDFIKLSPDQLKLFVAVRFETRDAAKECVRKYKDGDVLGYQVEMSWFKDIRRYVSYQQSQGLRPATVPRNRYQNRSYNTRTSYERSSRNDYRDDEYEGSSRRKRTSSGDRRSKRSHTRSDSSSRSPSRSPRHSSHERSRSAESHQSDNSQHNDHSRSHSRVSASPTTRERRTTSPPGTSPLPQKRMNEVIEKGSTPPLPPTPAPNSANNVKQLSKEDAANRKSPSPMSRSPSPAPERKLRKSRRDKKKKRRRSPSSSSSSSSEEERASEELSEGELRKKILKKRQKALLEEQQPDEPMKTNGKTSGKWEEKEPSRPESSLLQNTTLKFGLESSLQDDMPKRILKEIPSQFQSKKMSQSSQIVSVNSIKQESLSGYTRLTPPPLPPRLIKTEGQVSEPIPNYSKKGAIDTDKKLEMSKADAASSSLLFNTDIDSLLGKRSNAQASSNPAMLDDLKNTNAFSSIRGQQTQMSMRMLDEPDEPLQSSQGGGLRLSSFARQINMETERDRKLSRLPPELLAKFVAKKKQFDAALKADCETFAFVTKTLIQKDPGLEDRLRMALADAIKDMEDSFTVKIDQYLDQLFMFISM